MNENSLLLERIKNGDREAEEQLVINNMGLVRSIVGKFSAYGYETEDLSQIGAMGLIKAIHRFDVSYGVKFSTYAVPVIMGEIKRFLRDDGIIKVSRSIRENAMKGRKCESNLRAKLGREPTIEEISADSGITVEELLEAFDAALPVESITSVNSEGKETEAAIPSNENNEDKIINRVLIENMMKSLSQREKQILVLRYFRGKTQTETSKIIGVSQVQISRIEKATINKLRSEFAE